MRPFSFCLSILLLVSASPCLAGAPITNIVFGLAGNQEVPPVPSPATGGCMGVLDEGAASFSVTCVHTVASATLMHIHRGALGENGPVAFDLGDPASPVTAVWESMSASDIMEVLTGALYVNVHSAGRPGGEIRGQIRRLAPDAFTFSMDGSQQVPPDTSTATGLCGVDLSADGTMLAVDCVHDVTDPSDAHIHEGFTGENGANVFTFADAANPSGTKAMTPEDVARFMAGGFYVNIHSPTGMGEPGDGDPGEIRGQMIPGPIFTDGFESGDIAAWSFSVP